MALYIGGTAVDATAAEIDVLDGLDRGSIIYGNASSATTVLDNGTANQVLTSDGTDIAWAAAGAGGSFALISNTTITDADSIDFSNVFDNTNDSYLFIGSMWKNEEDNEQIQIRFQTGGDTWQDGSTYDTQQRYGTNGWGGTAINVTGGTEGCVVGLGNSGNDTGEFANFKLTIFQPYLAAYQYWHSDSVNKTFNGDTAWGDGGGSWNSSTIVTGVQFFFNTNQIASGNLAFYRMKSS